VAVAVVLLMVMMVVVVMLVVVEVVHILLEHTVPLIFQVVYQLV